MLQPRMSSDWPAADVLDESSPLQTLTFTIPDRSTCRRSQMRLAGLPARPLPLRDGELLVNALADPRHPPSSYPGIEGSRAAVGMTVPAVQKRTRRESGIPRTRL